MDEPESTRPYGVSPTLGRMVLVLLLCLGLVACRHYPSSFCLTGPVPSLEYTDAGLPPSQAETVMTMSDSRGNPLEYARWVESVICTDGECHVIHVQLFWTSLGNYKRYQFNQGANLTKLEHVPFSRVEHQRLHEILQDPDSPLREETKQSMVAKSVDGISGATIKALAPHVVTGGGFTCHNLWHLAHGRLAKEIREQTGMTCTKQRLKEYAASSDPEEQQFGLEFLQKRGVQLSQVRVPSVESIDLDRCDGQDCPSSLVENRKVFLRREGNPAL